MVLFDSPGEYGTPLVARQWRLSTAVCALLLTSTTVLGQGSTTATVRGTVQDPSGGVLPGATVTATNTGTKGVQTAVSDDRGQYLFAGLFPGTYDLKVELSGFKTYEQKGLSLSPSDNRGIDVRLEIGSQTETVTVTGQLEVIQTQTGAREGVLTAKQIDNLSIIGRSALELMRILPGVVAEFNVGESVSFGGGGNNTQGYTVNGIRSSSNTVSLDGSSLIDIGSNSGVIVSLNNDMIQEVKVQSSNFAAEHGTGGMSVSGVTKAGSLAVPRLGLRLLARPSASPPTIARTASPLTPKPKSTYQYPGGNVGGPIVFGDSYTKNRDRLFFFAAFEVQRQKVDSGSFFTRTYSDAMKNGDFSELLANRGSNLNSIPQLRIPRGFPDAGQPAPNNDMRPYVTPMGQLPREPLSARRTSTIRATSTTTCTAGSSRRTGTTSRRASTGTSATTPRRTCGSPTRERRSSRPAACGGRSRPTSHCRPRTSVRTRAAPTPATSSRC